MEHHNCEFCSVAFPLLVDKTYYKRDTTIRDNANFPIEQLNIFFYICPSCNMSSVRIKSMYGTFQEKINFQYPNAQYQLYPDYVPLSIRQDYEEACSILSLSPRASATLFRRCLQGIIRDFWKIELKDNRLVKEIDALKDSIDPALWKAFDAVRSIGNIAAHMEKDINLIIDVDTNEAEILAELIQFVIKETYINRYEREQLLLKVVAISQEKKEQKQQKEELTK